MKNLKSATTIWLLGLLLLLLSPAWGETESRELTLATDLPLGATLEYPSKRNGKLPGLVLMHGSGPQDRDCTMPIGLFGLHPFRRLSQSLAERGFVVLRYDKRSYRVVQDKRKDLLPSLLPEVFVADAVLACQTLAEQPEVDPSRVYLVGHSQGGTFGPWVASQTKLAGLVLLAPGILGFQEQVEYQLAYQLKKMEEQNTLGLANSKIEQTKKIREQYRTLFAKIKDPEVPDDAMLGGATAKFYRQYQLKSSEFLDNMATLKIPTLIINGTEDLKCPDVLLKKYQERLLKNSHVSIVYRPGTAHELYQRNYTLFDEGVAEEIERWLDENS